MKQNRRARLPRLSLGRQYLLNTDLVNHVLPGTGRRDAPRRVRTSRTPAHRHGLPSPSQQPSKGASCAPGAAHGIPRSELLISPTDTAADASALCQSCGACCSFSKEWPRFSTESDADLDRIPPAYVDDTQARMRCSGDRCTALVGQVGVATACGVYAVRPEVCRTCVPGDDACQMARRRFGLSPIVGFPLG
ncbi:MAG TPA: YkgJ family cysteine cluster protein [Steroidobacteraceae bacterium]